MKNSNLYKIVLVTVLLCFSSTVMALATEAKSNKTFINPMVLKNKQVRDAQKRGDFSQGLQYGRQQIDTAIPTILGEPLATEEQCLKYLLSVNPRPAITVSPEELVRSYYEEGRREGVRPDIAFAQALKETGYFRYGGHVVYRQNNYCGLGTIGAGVAGAWFPNAQIGVRAHIQHILAYSSKKRPSQPIVDPRYELVASGNYFGEARTWSDLNGKWAIPGYGYGERILTIYSEILRQ